MQDEGLDVTALPTGIEDAIWALAEGPAADFASGIAALCARHQEYRGQIEAVAALCGTPGEAPPGNEHGRVEPTPADELMSRLAGGPRLDHRRYEVEGVAGIGGMGKVLRIRDRTLNRRLAMKVRHARGRPVDDGERSVQEALQRRFLEEAQVQSQIDHPGVPPVHELGLDAQGVPCFTMRFVEGHTAAVVFGWARARQEGWTITRALEVILKVCDTMGYAHEKGVLHRDLKPGNVMVGRFGEVYVTDWGLAKLIGQGEGSDAAGAGGGTAGIPAARTLPLHRPGTAFFMSPEQARGETLDARTDVYAVGAMLYALLTGRLPHDRGGDESSSRVLAAVRQGPPQRIEAIERGVAPELVAIVEKAMAFDRLERYSAMSELAADLRAYLDQRVVRAYRTGALIELRLWVRRNRALAASLAAAALILVVGIAVALAEKKRADEEAAAKTRLAAEKSRTVDQFQQLAAQVRYEHVVAKERELWPPWPAKIAAMEEWLQQDVGELLAMRPRLDATIAELRQQALPATPEEAETDRRSHARYAEYEAQQCWVASHRRAQAIRDGAPLVVPELAAEVRALDGEGLNVFAWKRVAPRAKEGEKAEREVFGEEPVALAAARTAVAKEPRREFLGTLAWAALANGQDDEARRASAQALAVAPAAEREQYTGFQRAIEAASVEARPRLAAAEVQLAELERAVGSRRTWTFPRDTDGEAARFLHGVLVDLVGKLDSLMATEKADVEQRLRWARMLREYMPKQAKRWEEARAAIAKADGVVASALYAGQSIELLDEAMVGLVPIGMNPATKLWEFYELRSAWDGHQRIESIAIPAHRADGSIEVTGDTGIVFALLPGGTFTMGAQDKDEAGPNFDAATGATKTPHSVTLASFFLARHELTRKQWERLTETRPFLLADGDGPDRMAIGPSHPADSIDWLEADRWTRRHGMTLPTEAQWEYGCRAGTSTVWWSGNEAKDLQGIANVHDETSAQGAPEWGTPAPITDGFVGPAPVGSFIANAFGLFDIHGNVWEWCLDQYGEYSVPVRPGDGLRLVRSSSDSRVLRGGGYGDQVANARAANRSWNAPTIRDDGLGVRPARTIGR